MDLTILGSRYIQGGLLDSKHSAEDVKCEQRHLAARRGNMGKVSLQLGDVTTVHREVLMARGFSFYVSSSVPIVIFMETVRYTMSLDISPTSSFIYKLRSSINSGLLLYAKQLDLLLPKAKRKVFIGTIKIQIKVIISRLSCQSYKRII